VRVEAADVIGVEKSNGPGGLPRTASARRPFDTDDSDIFAGDFVRYAVLISRPSCAEPIKYEAHFDYSPCPTLVSDPHQVAGRRLGAAVALSAGIPTIGWLLQLG